METLVIFLLILLVLVLSHEAGHFFTARAFGIRVEEFGFGLPPRIFGIKKKDTLYSLNLLPFGGFVKIFGEEGLPDEVSTKAGEENGNQGSFGAKSSWVRSLVLLAGVAANVFLAFLIFSLASLLGVPKAIPDEAQTASQASVTVIDISDDSPARKAGILLGDQINKLNDFYPRSVGDVQKFIGDNKGKEVEITLTRNGDTLQRKITPRTQPPEGEGPLGIALSLIALERSLWYLAPWDGFKTTVSVAYGTISGFWEIAKNLTQAEKAGIEVAGPVGIFNLTASARKFGLGTLLFFIGVLSVNLAIINALPFPGLDGGRFFFIVLEVIRGRKISPKTSAIAHSIGLAILILLLALITSRDIAKIF